MQKLYDYESLIQKFLNQEISVQEFECTYLDKYLAEKAPIGNELFETLDWLFAEVDAYTDIEEAINERPEAHISEDQLRAKSQPWFCARSGRRPKLLHCKK